jgi:hypothetical protein
MLWSKNMLPVVLPAHVVRINVQLTFFPCTLCSRSIAVKLDRRLARDEKIHVPKKQKTCGNANRATDDKNERHSASRFTWHADAHDWMTFGHAREGYERHLNERKLEERGGRGGREAQKYSEWREKKTL